VPTILAGGIDPGTLYGYPSANPQTTASAFVIDVYDPQTLQTITSVILTGRALPYRPAEFSGKLRLQTTWYPGNPVATAQVLGPLESPSTFHGMWKDRFISGPAWDGTVSDSIPPAQLTNDFADFSSGGLNSAADLCDLLDAIRRSGLPVRVTWDQWVRLGFLTEFGFKPHRHQDVEWTATFTWISQDDVDVPANNPTGADLAGAANAFQNKLNALSGAMMQASDTLQSAIQLPEVKADAALVQNLSTTFVASVHGVENAINSDIGSIEGAIQGVQDTASGLVSDVITPVQSVQRAAALANLVQASADDIIGQIEGQTAQALYSPNPAAPGLLALVQTWATPTAGQTMAAKLAARNIKDGARDLKYEGANQALAFLQTSSQPVVIQAFVALAGQDLRFVSTFFYGTPDEWISLMAFNGLSSSALTAGQVVFVPVRRAGS
jgi:hypothetical protein